MAHWLLEVTEKMKYKTPEKVVSFVKYEKLKNIIIQNPPFAK